ncbi:CX module [Trichostrongylus colubriformis]|uniref:CX module n=1 Tax=Trichostrongylus colubriformis TaxID=6319 RepID=A0AAN8FAT0_TRICO
MILHRLCVFTLLLGSVTMARRGGGGSRGGRGHSRARFASSPRFTRKYAKTGSIERTSLFRSTVFGAAAGYLTFRAGRHIINDPYQPIMFGSRSYYWNTDLQKPTEELPVQCVNKIDPQDPQFGRVYFPNDTRPTEIAYGCAEGDYCCGYDCCQEGTFFTSLFRLLVFILVMSVFGVICIEVSRCISLPFTSLCAFCSTSHTL